jgi:flagellar biosynthesis/type III secretory pathway chaperone
MTNTTPESVQNGLNTVLQQILTQGKPSHQNLDQLEKDIVKLNIELKNTEDQDVSQNISNLIHLIESILKKYRKATAAIQITRENKKKLHDIAATYDQAITHLLEFYDNNH